MRKAFMQPASVFIRVLIIAAALSSCAIASADRQALLVGIDQYPFISEPFQQLHGAATDISQMKLVLEYCGFKVRTLKGSAATGSAIRIAMKDLSGSVRSGDERLFYFSGRGSVAFDGAGGKTQDLEPTLAPSDCAQDTSKGDIAFSELEGWASAIEAKKAVPILIVDACYSAPGARGEDRYYKNVPRCIQRPGTPRTQLYSGPGVFLSACPSDGAAYEWRVDFDSDSWAGAFTDELTDTAMAWIQKSRFATYAELMDEVRKFFAARPDYMAGLAPYPRADSMKGEYLRPAFVPVKTTAPTIASKPTPSPSSAQAVDKRNRKRKEKAVYLRIGLETISASRSARKQDLAEFVDGPLAKEIRGRCPGISIVPQYGDRPDRIVRVNQVSDGYEASVTGDEVDASRKPTFLGKNAGALVRAGLGEYLERQTYVMRLYRLIETASPTLAGDWKAGPTKAKYRRGELFSIKVTAPSAGYVYLFDQDESDGIIQLVWPAAADFENNVQAGESRIPKREFEVNRETPIGTTMVRALFISSPQSLPRLAPKSGSWLRPDGSADPAYTKAELAHLKALTSAIESGKAKWSMREFKYSVVE